ncbi:3',5'-cyclic adenosine monophosphate phosphodiesterase CpdA [Dictyobacter sp. S3.2.2.5]|uniref:3',5'-cyclic adenosine monophosphate phosphodiesterase CpdA n=1 Tax=Dictyobacter halimunensis TaxID=3026934 RepID=A0ABQ6G8T0_9CHLR|nr:3',5'-cyclic adenosine monophosphate phosphodiesterase CpdA [Dictyobacter sp. S3.2.2.5]
MAFSFVQITDHHLCDTESLLLQGYSPAYALRTVLRHIAEHVADHIDFIVTTGDIVDNASAISYGNACQMLQLQTTSQAPGPARMTLEGLQDFPLYFLPGNHDDRDHFFRQFFSDTPPMSWMNVSFQHKGIQFICLDWGPQGKAIAQPEMLAFLTRCLQNGQPSIILTHHHLVPFGIHWIDAFLPVAADSEAFWSILGAHQSQVLGIFSGHAHVTYERVVNGIPLFGLRSTAPQPVMQDEPLLCLQPPHYRLVTVQDTFLTTRIFEVPL